MKLDKVLAMGAYAFQAFATLALVFGVSRVLPTSEYGHYSLIVATAQSAAVIAFEWIRLAAVRYCSGVEGEEAAKRLATTQVTFGAAALTLILVAGVLAATQWISPTDVAVGTLVAILVGITDLQLMFLRANGSFLQFAALQCGRSLAILLASVSAAYALQTAGGGLIGMAAGYAVSLGIFVAADPGWWRWQWRLACSTTFKNMARYGASAAAASMIHLQVPLLMRWIAKAHLGTEVFAGVSLAMDILQKPFALVTSAISGILTPGVIAEFERANDPRSPALQRLYEAQIWSVLLLLGGTLAFLSDMCDLAIKPALQAPLLASGPAIAMTFAGHTLIQATVAIPGHLLQLGARLITNAIVELSLVGLCVFATMYWPDSLPYAWLWMITGAVAASIVYGLPMVRKVPCPAPTSALLLSLTTCGMLTLVGQWHSHGNWLILAAKAALCALMTGTALLMWLRMKNKPSPTKTAP